MGEQPSQAAEGCFALREVAHLLDLPPARLRGWVRAGFVEPARAAGGTLRFSFRDVALLRRLRDLHADHVPARRVRRALDRLRARGGAEALAGLAPGTTRGEVVVREGATLWSPESGQCVFDFDARDPRRRVVALRASGTGTRGRTEGGETSVPEPARVPPAQADLDVGGSPAAAPDRARAQAWYRAACDVATRDVDAAAAACRRAIALDPQHADAHLDLGCLEHERGNLDAAERHYHDALALRPADATTLFDLGVLLEDRGRTQEARQRYDAALAADPTLADAHYNLARLCVREGDARGAVRHWTAYRKLSEG